MLSLVLVCLFAGLIILAIALSIRRIDITSPAGQIGLRLWLLIIVCLVAGVVIGTFPPIAGRGAPWWTAIGEILLPNSGVVQFDPTIPSPDPSKYTFDKGTLRLAEPPVGHNTVLWWERGVAAPDQRGTLVVRGTATYAIGKDAENVKVMFLSDDKRKATHAVPLGF